MVFSELVVSVSRLLQGKKLATDSVAARRLNSRRGDPTRSPGPSPGQGHPSPSEGPDMFEASFSAFNVGPVGPANENIGFSTDTSNFAAAGVIGESEAFGSFDGEVNADGTQNFVDAFGKASDWGSGQGEHGNSGMVDDGFPAHGESEADMTAKLERADADRRRSPRDA